jgi:uncharacterized membrane protein YeiB
MLSHASSAAAPRVVALDVLRGFALCGVLVADVPLVTSFGSALAPSAPTLQDPGGWLALFVHQRFLPILSLLFGVGFSLAAASAVRRGAHPRAVLLRHLLALLAIGLVHQLWRPGEAVALYAAVGLLVLLPSTWLPRGAVAVVALVLVAAALVAPHGGVVLVAGLCLLGSALARYGVVDRLDRPRPHGEPFVLALAAAAGAALVVQLHDLPRSGFTAASATAGLLLAGVYAAGVVLALPTRVGPLLRAVFAPLGRLSLTNYVLATPVLVAAGRVLDLPHSRSWDRVLLLAGGILAVQWVFSTLWLRRFPHGPLELLRRRVARGDDGPRRHRSGAVVPGLTVAAVNVTAVAALVAAGWVSHGTGGAPGGPVPVAAVATAGARTAHGAANPEDVLLPDEGRRSSAPEFTDWATDRRLDRSWLLDPCRPTAHPTDARRTGFRTVTRRGPEVEEGRQLAVYPAPEVAAEAVAGFRRALVACRTGGRAAEGNRWEWVTADAPDLGDGFVAASTIGGPGYSPTGDRIAVTRRGSAVFLAFNRGEYATARLDGGTRAVRDVARAFLASVGGR